MLYQSKHFLYIYQSFRHFRKYSAGLRFPAHLQIQTQSLCNGECPICPNSTLRGKRKQGIMAQELFEKIVDEIADEPSTCTLCFMLQNEPLLDKRIFRWIEYFKSLNQKKASSLVTNGELINEFTLEEIIQSRLDELVISLNAYTERTFNIVNKGVDYKRVIENIDLLLSNAIMRPKIKLSFLLTRNNEREITGAIRYWNKKGVKTRLIFPTNRAGEIKNYHCYRSNSMLINKPLHISRKMRNYYYKNILEGCPLPFYSMSILFNGDVILCCQDWRSSPIIGNVSRASIREVWNSNKFNRIRRLILEKKYKDMASCSQCSIATFYHQVKCQSQKISGFRNNSI